MKFDCIMTTFVTCTLHQVIKSRNMRWEGHAACIGEMRKEYKILVWKLKGKRLLGRLKRRS